MKYSVVLKFLALLLCACCLLISVGSACGIIALVEAGLYTTDVEEMKATNLMDCIECGCCAYNCPACVPLVLAFRSGKQRIRDAAAAVAKK